MIFLFSAAQVKKMILSALVLDVKVSLLGKYSAVIIIMIEKEASYLDKPVRTFKQQNKADDLFAEMEDKIVD